MITENSFGYNDVLEDGNIINDDYRIQYLNDHFEQIKLAVDDGVECLAYLLWGIVDIVSAGSLEMTKRYMWTPTTSVTVHIKDIKRRVLNSTRIL